MGDSRLRVVFSVIRSLAVLFYLRTLYIDSFVKGTFPPNRKIVPSNSKPVPILTIKHVPEEHKDKAQEVTVMEEDAPRPLREERQTKIPPRSERTVFVATEGRRLVQKGLLLDCDGIQA